MASGKIAPENLWQPWDTPTVTGLTKEAFVMQNGADLGLLWRRHNLVNNKTDDLLFTICISAPHTSSRREPVPYNTRQRWQIRHSRSQGHYAWPRFMWKKTREPSTVAKNASICTDQQHGAWQCQWMLNVAWHVAWLWHRFILETPNGWTIRPEKQ